MRGAVARLAVFGPHGAGDDQRLAALSGVFRGQAMNERERRRSDERVGDRMEREVRVGREPNEIAGGDGTLDARWRGEEGELFGARMAVHALDAGAGAVKRLCGRERREGT